MKMILNNDKNSCSAIILAGGKSSRMKYPKPWLKDSDGITFLERIVSTIQQCEVNDIIVVLNQEFAEKPWNNFVRHLKMKSAKIVLNSSPEKGRVYSIKLGLEAAKSVNVLIHNVDSPYVGSEVFTRLIQHQGQGGVVIPQYDLKSGHPILINSQVSEELIKNGHSYETLREVLLNFKKHYVKVDDDTILNNINTPSELEEVKYGLV